MEELFANPFVYSRRKSREVRVGGIEIGGSAPVRVQSMTTTSGSDVAESIDQARALAKVGAELVRITAPALQDAEKLRQVVGSLRHEGLDIPIVADIHFSPEAAIRAAQYVDKVRINPGNYTSGKACRTETEYAQALGDIRARLEPLLVRCRSRGVAIRIGVNHGSLSPRIIERYGAGIEGLVQSALELIALCRSCDFHDLVISLKASEPRLMVQANRLMALRMLQRGWDYPLHLGVTEAGAGEDGRVKSAVGIGSLLVDGVGDTIRVSLTEDPVAEIPVAKRIVEVTKALTSVSEKESAAKISPASDLPYNPYYTSYQSRVRPPILQRRPKGLLLARVNLQFDEQEDPSHLWTTLGFKRAVNSIWIPTDESADLAIIPKELQESVPQELRSYVAVESESQNLSAIDGSWLLRIVALQEILKYPTRLAQELQLQPEKIILLRADPPNVQLLRRAIVSLRQLSINNTLLIDPDCLDEWRSLSPDPTYFSMLAGALLIDYLADGVAVDITRDSSPRRTALSLLQVCELRRVKADFIACPGCGRTLFGLEETLERIKQSTSHLRKLKIGVMGCIVNGPGEMAGADYGYVGAGPGKITLYKGMSVVKRNIPAADALDELIAIIQENGDWEDPD